jgi:circadian clock protein KaiB
MKKKSTPAKKKPRRAPARTRPAKTRAPARARAGAAKPEPWLLRLYVAGETPNSLSAFSNLKQICDEHLTDHYRIEVIDLTKAPHRAHDDQIVALPTLIRKKPEPTKRVIGNLANLDRVLLGMEVPAKLRPKAAQAVV